MRRYPEYKESGVEWIGELPKNWEVKKIKNTQSYLVGGIWGNEPEGNENDIYCIRVADFNYEQLTISTHNLTLRNIPLKEKDKRILKNYDLLIEKSGGGEKSPVGKTVMFNAEISRQSVTSNFITKFTAKSDSCFPKYVLYCLCFFYHIGLTRKHIKQTTGIQNLYIDSYFQERIPLPSIVEQTQIANFLDRKTEQIDELIRIKERRIKLLQEQRTALINQAVTKGLDPNVEMKPSGMEWIGKIPTHWEVINTKYLFQLVTEPAPKNNDYELLSIYTNIGVKPRKELEERGNRATTTDGYWLVKKGDFIVNKLLAWMGAIGLSNYEGVTSPAYDILRKTRSLNERFYEYLFRCGLYFTEFKKRSRGIMEVRLRLYFDQFGQIPLVFPPVDEQDKIVNLLDNKTEQIDELISTEQQKIKLLKEYRQSLISEAVTGKIDVRNEV